MPPPTTDPTNGAKGAKGPNKGDTSVPAPMPSKPPAAPPTSPCSKDNPAPAIGIYLPAILPATELIVAPGGNTDLTFVRRLGASSASACRNAFSNFS